MKILFAVSNENVSKRIVDSYKKKYGEAVSFKNVFYFNAIIREIHKDKTYDRIVISEDLEPFASSNYDVIDKFILERMKQIANEVNAQERYIDIVVICTDRRTKSGFVLSKMYEYGIYNALVGQDRRIDNVCTLLNTPRTANEAKEYYKIDSQNDTSSVDDVSEQEVQNILIHYKRLGKNEDRYTDSFNNIASQYTDKQLKIIIKCLPINVRAVLEAECPKYQELVTYAEETEEERKQKQKIQEKRRVEQIENDRKLKQKVEKERREAERKAQRDKLSAQKPRNTATQTTNQANSGIDLLDNKHREQRMTGNVIIPNNMNVRNERKVYTDDELNNMKNRKPRTITTEESERTNQAQTAPNPTTSNINTAKTQQQSTLPGFDDFENVQQPASTPQGTNTLPGFDDFEDVQQPVTTPQEANTLPGFDDFEDVQQPVATPQEANTLPGFDDFEDVQQPVATPQEVNTLPGFDDFEDVQQPVATPQEANTLPEFDDFEDVQQPVAAPQEANTLPGFDDFEDVKQPVAAPQEANTLPGFDNFEDVKQPVATPQEANTLPGFDDFEDVQQPVAASQETNILPGFNDLENEQQPIRNEIPSQQEVAQPVKRGRGRPRKYPVEPPKPKGKRGRPRKNPLPEETEPKTQILPGVNDFEDIPELNKIEPTESGSPIVEQDKAQLQTQNEEKQINNDWSQESYTNNINTNEIPATNDWKDDPFAVPAQNNIAQTPNDDWDSDPFAVPAQNNTAQTPNDDWDNDPFAVPSQNNTAQTPNDDWDNDPFAVPAQNNTVQTPNDDWDNDPFAVPAQNNTVQTPNDDWANDPFAVPAQNNTAQTPNDDLDNDPFAVPSQNNTAQTPNDDWNQAPLAENTTSASQAQEPSNLPGLDDDWARDPFTNTVSNATQDSSNLQELDDDLNNDLAESAQTTTAQEADDDWNRDPFEDDLSNNTQQMQQANSLPGLDDDWSNDPFATSEPNNATQAADDDWNSDPFADDLTNATQNTQQSQNYDNDSLSAPQYNKQTMQTAGNYNNYQTQYQGQIQEQAIPYSPSKERRESIQKIEENKLYTTGSLNTVLTKDKKIVAFVGTSKSGTSFLVNNLANLFSSIGVKTAILDMTKNKNAYYIYTDNNENLRNIAFTSIENLENGIAEGIKVDRNLNVYTALPNDNKDYSNAEAILSTLVQNESLVLIDCDFNTDFEYFANAQEIYLVQSMDILTIQPLTAFLRELKTKGLLDEEKLRIVVNKELRVKSLSSKSIIGGMSFYIDPAMSYMTELFNKDKVKACTIPFDENVYAKYLEQTLNCAISISGYNKNFMNSLKILGNMVYPLLSKQTYNASRNTFEASNYGNKFSNQMNDTLNQMKNKY